MRAPETPVERLIHVIREHGVVCQLSHDRDEVPQYCNSDSVVERAWANVWNEVGHLVRESDLPRQSLMYRLIGQVSFLDFMIFPANDRAQGQNGEPIEWTQAEMYKADIRAMYMHLGCSLGNAYPGNPLHGILQEYGLIEFYARIRQALDYQDSLCEAQYAPESDMEDY